MPDAVGFIGLGVMGAPMARNVRKAFERVVVYDLDRERVELFSPEEFGRAGSCREVAEQCRLVLLSLPGSAAVESVVLGPDGLAEVLPEGGVVIDTGTTEPAVSRRLAERLRESGRAFLDAPVSGGEKAAIAGTLSFMVGGDAEVFEECLPLLRTMGASVVRIGASGAGSVAKLVNNLIVGAEFAAIAAGVPFGTPGTTNLLRIALPPPATQPACAQAVAEGFVLAARSGLDPSVLYEAIRGGWAQSKVLDVSAEALLSRDFQPGGSVDIHWKDLGYALSLAKDVDVPTPVTAIVHEVFKAARAGGLGALAQPAIVMLWEELLGLRVGRDEDDQSA